MQGLIDSNQDRKREFDALKQDHDKLRGDHNNFENSATRENDLRKNEVNETIYYDSS